MQHSQHKRHNTQWAAQFAVASELCKRGYDVGFTMGHNTPLADLMVIAPNGKSTFLVDVKGQSGKNFWRIKAKSERKDLYYVLAFVPVEGDNQFFVLSQTELNSLMDEYEHSGVKFDPVHAGINWKAPHKFKDSWVSLPK